MSVAALVSALQVKPQAEQTNPAWFLGGVLPFHPQAETYLASRATTRAKPAATR